MSEENGSNGRGRPPGVKNGEGTSLEPIKNWSPLHDTVVSLHCSLHSNQEIAEMASITPQRVSQILNDPQGKRLVREHQERLRERFAENVEEGLVAICVKALDNIRETVELEGLAVGSDFKKHQDNVSLALLKGRGFLGTDVAPISERRSEIPKILAERIATALEKTAQVAVELEKQKEGKEIVQEEVLEGDFTLVD